MHSCVGQASPPVGWPLKRRWDHKYLFIFGAIKGKLFGGQEAMFRADGGCLSIGGGSGQCGVHAWILLIFQAMPTPYFLCSWGDPRNKFDVQRHANLAFLFFAPTWASSHQAAQRLLLGWQRPAARPLRAKYQAEAEAQTPLQPSIILLEGPAPGADGLGARLKYTLVIFGAIAGIAPNWRDYLED